MAHHVTEDINLTEAQVESLEEIKKELDRASLASELRLLAQTKKLYEKRRPTLRTIPRFWPTAFANHADLESLAQHREDMLLLGHLCDVWVERDHSEPRAYTIEFHFSENPYFSDLVLRKEIKYVPVPPDDADETPSAVKGDDGVSEAMLAFDPDVDLQPQPTKISWKSDSKNLVKLYPLKVEVDDENDVLDPGSIFNFFDSDKDPSNIASIIVEDIYPEAINYFLGKGPTNREVQDDDDTGSEEEDDDDDAEIDLERPKKKVKKT